jgi:hypothetical protein
VINVGTATIAAFIGAGGYGERIVTGLALNDHAMLLAGAIPAAVMALLIELGFRYAERWLLPRDCARADRATRRGMSETKQPFKDLRGDHRPYARPLQPARRAILGRHARP